MYIDLKTDYLLMCPEKGLVHYEISVIDTIFSDRYVGDIYDYKNIVELITEFEIIIECYCSRGINPEFALAKHICSYSQDVFSIEQLMFVLGIIDNSDQINTDRLNKLMILM